MRFGSVCSGIEAASVAYSVIGDVTPKVGENVCMTLRAQGGGRWNCTAKR